MSWMILSPSGAPASGPSIGSYNRLYAASKCFGVRLLNLFAWPSDKCDVRSAYRSTLSCRSWLRWLSKGIASVCIPTMQCLLGVPTNNPLSGTMKYSWNPIRSIYSYDSLATNKDSASWYTIQSSSCVVPLNAFSVCKNYDQAFC